MARAAQRTLREMAWLAARSVWAHPAVARLRGGVLAAAGLACILSLATYNAADPSWNAAGPIGPKNLLGGFGANLADVTMQSLGLAAWAAAGLMVFSGLARV